MPTKPVLALNGRIVRCILFDLGDTLWSRKDANLWHQLESASNRRAVALLREHISPTLLPTLNDDALGTRLRDALDEQVRTAIRLDPGREPEGGVAILEALRQWGIRAH